MPSSRSEPPPPAAVPLAPGFRFHPTDEELVSYYLRRRVLGRPLRLDAIAEVDLYRLEPWDLPSLSRIRSRDAQWYFFARLDRKVAGAGAGGRGGPGNRTNRATPRGYWKTTGKDREVWHRGKAVGMKKTLVFHAGRAPKGDRTNWVMHEYRLLDAGGPQDLLVVCRIFQKTGAGPQNGAQYGAPYMEEEWEEEDEAVEAAAASGAATEMAVMTDTGDEESNEVDENGYMETNELAQNKGLLNPPEMAPLPANGSNETDDGSHAGDVISLEEILKEPASDGIENICKPEEQHVMDDNFSIADFSHCPSQNDGYVDQDGLTDPVNWNGLSNGDSTFWPLRAYSNQNCVNDVDVRRNLQEVLNVEEYFDSGDGTNSLSGQSQNCPSEYQNSYLQANDLPAPQQVDDNMVFYDASSSHTWANGKEDFVNLNDLLYSPIENPSLFDGGDDLMAYFDATENDIKYDIVGSAGQLEGNNSPLPDMSNFTQKVDDVDGFTFNGTSKTLDANALCGTSSSGSRKDLYPGIAGPDAPRDDSVDKTFGKRLANMLGSIPAPPAMAAEFPPAPGKSVGPISAVNSPSSIRVTAGIIQLGGLTFTGEHWSLQKNGDYDFLLSFTVAGDVSTKSVGFEPVTRMHGGAISMVLRSGFSLFFVSTIILALSYKVGLCIYGR